MVLTEDQQTDMYPALSFEGAQGSDEVKGQDAIWDNSNGQSIDIVNSRMSRPANFGTSGSNGSYVKQVTKASGAIGAAKMLKVMSGDKIDVSVDYYYTVTNANNSGANGLNTLLNSIVGMISGSDAAGALVKSDATAVFNNLTASPDVSGFFTPGGASTGGTNNPPKAYLHVLLFDERFVFDNTNSYVKQVDYNPNARLAITKTDLTVKKNGYAYVYFSNESNDVVYFDNFMLSHKRGPLLEETHYYPFGLTMAGISSKALSFGEPQNKRLFNFGSELASKEFSDGSGLEIYETNFRGLDPQLGRWWQRDPLAEFHYGISPYAYVLNNPLSYNDPLGLDTVRVNGAGSHKIQIGPGDVLAFTIGDQTSYYTYDPNNKDAVDGFVGGGIQNDAPLPEVTVTAKAKPKENNSGPLAWASLAGLVNNSVNTGVGYLENFTNAKTTLGYGFKEPWYKLKLYPSGWAGNQHVSTFNITKASKLAGMITFGVGTALDAYGVYTYYTQGAENPNAVHPAKAGVNLGVGAYGLYGGPPGWVIGTIYFGIDATIGWPAATQSYMEMEKNKAEMRKQNIMTFSDFKY